MLAFFVTAVAFGVGDLRVLRRVRYEQVEARQRRRQRQPAGQEDAFLLRRVQPLPLPATE